MTTRLDRIAEKAKESPQLRFTSLADTLNPEFLRETWEKLNRRGAAGVDGQTATAGDTYYGRSAGPGIGGTYTQCFIRAFVS